MLIPRKQKMVFCMALRTTQKRAQPGQVAQLHSTGKCLFMLGNPPGVDDFRTAR